MDNVVSARRLRKSMLKDIDNNYIDNLDINNYRRVSIENEKEETKNVKKINKFKVKLFLKIFISIGIIFTCLIIKLLFYNNIKDNKYLSILKREYIKNYEKEYVLLKTENFFRNNEKNISYIFPNSVINCVKNFYHSKLKDVYMNFEVKDVYNYLINNNNTQNTTTVSVFNNNDTSEINKNEEKTKIEEKVVNPLSTLSSMDLDIEEIKKKNINIISPVSGTITSVYGAREEIIKGVGTFHTGVDIANNLNTDIKSATDGIVTKVEENNKYYGNNIEITINDVTFKYAHLNKIEVKQNSKIKQGDIIGKMGSTGFSTGSHLHFEISINSRTIDPQKLVDIR